MTKTPDTTEDSIWERCGDTTPRDRRNARIYLFLTAVWALVFLVATWLLERQLVPAGPLSWMTALLPTVVGILVGVTYTRYLIQADELQRLKQLRALALGFGGGWLALTGYPLLERVGAPGLDAGDYLVFMVAVFLVGALLGRRRYR